MLFSGTIKENLRWGNENATDEEMIRACQLAQADGFIREFHNGYDTYIEQGGTNVSGGQRQRICIARALLKNPKVLILDDSTSAVDTRTDERIRHALKEQIPDVTKIIIALRVASVKDAPDHRAGRRQALAWVHQRLLKTTISTRNYRSQNKGCDACLKRRPLPARLHQTKAEPRFKPGTLKRLLIHG